MTSIRFAASPRLHKYKINLVALYYFGVDTQALEGGLTLFLHMAPLSFVYNLVKVLFFKWGEGIRAVMLTAGMSKKQSEGFGSIRLDIRRFVDLCCTRNLGDILVEPFILRTHVVKESAEYFVIRCRNGSIFWHVQLKF